MNTPKLVSALALTALLLTPVTASAGCLSFGAPLAPPPLVGGLMSMVLVAFALLIPVGYFLVLGAPFLLLTFVVCKFERKRRREARSRQAAVEEQGYKAADSGAEESPGLVEELRDR